MRKFLDENQKREEKKPKIKNKKNPERPVGYVCVGKDIMKRNAWIHEVCVLL
jgi:hypothetical protein